MEKISNITFSNLIDFFPEMIFIFNKSGEIIFKNKSINDILEKNYDSVYILNKDKIVNHCKLNLGSKIKNSKDIIFYRDCFLNEIVEDVFEKKENIHNLEGEMKLFVGEQEEKLDIILNVVYFTDNNKEYVLVSIRNITDVKEFERRKIAEYEKLALIGSTVASIIHDLRNPLTGISGYNYILSTKAKNEKEEKMFKRIDRNINKINNMLEEVMSFANGKEKIEIIKNRVKVHDFINYVLEDFHFNDIEIEFDLGDINIEIEIDENKMQHVFWNLIKNASEAIVDSGYIKIKFRETEDKYIFEVEDNGKGIPENLKDKLFTPGATFGKKNGNGFGLLSCKTIVHSHNGEIYFESEEKKGTKFIIELPKK
ncbi:two-component system sensor histidine kinase NtrB [Haliovirga abyssi]|uniref:histidine kinase n=1 Tax=Haliovirga abyssi TaxID=2996794 RepID=A0AAU9D928_9FUSO|nr:HAMP domain-containing sensor histidine kinase [Haliovirga abyssi]BDU50091.1 hypothetical protein HLVA_06600 [Haliovirga abyssi]